MTNHPGLPWGETFHIWDIHCLSLYYLAVYVFRDICLQGILCGYLFGLFVHLLFTYFKKALNSLYFFPFRCFLPGFYVLSKYSFPSLCSHALISCSKKFPWLLKPPYAWVPNPNPNPNYRIFHSQYPTRFFFSTRFFKVKVLTFCPLI